MQQGGGTPILPPERDPTERLDELGINHGAPWAWIRTAAPIDAPDGLIRPNYFQFTVNVPSVGRLEHREGFTPGADGIFGHEWHGYHYEAVGLLRRLRFGGLDYTAPPPGPRGPAVKWEIQQADAGLPLVGAESPLSFAPWWTCTYKPEADGSPPGLVAEARWIPGHDGGLWPFFRVNLPRDHSPTMAHLLAAQAGRELLSGVEQRMTEVRIPGPEPDFESPDELHAAVVTAIRSEWALRKRRPRLRDVAGFFTKDPLLPRSTADSLDQRIRRAGLNWKALLREGMPSS